MKVCIAGPFNVPGAIHAFREDDRHMLAELPGMGGYCVTELALARRSMGLDTVVISLDPRASGIERFKGDKIEYIVCPRRMKGLLRDAYARERRVLGEAIRMAGADVVHAHWLSEYAMGALDSGVPALITLHDHTLIMLKYLDARWILGALYALLTLRRGRFFTGVSPSVAKFGERVSGSKIPVIPNSYPLAVREMRSGGSPAKPFATGSLRIVSLLGSIGFKNAKGGLKAFGLIKGQVPEAEYRLVGPGLDKTGPLARWAAAEGLDEGVRFMGPLAHDKALDMVAKSDVLLHPSLQEACPNAVIEAMSLGRVVVVARNWADAEWVVEDGGILVDGRRPLEMAEAIVQLRSKSEDAWKIAEKAMKIAETKYAPENVVMLYENEYRKVLS